MARVKPGDRVRVVTWATSCTDGLRGVVMRIEPNGRPWVLLDGDAGEMLMFASELIVEGGPNEET